MLVGDQPVQLIAGTPLNAGADRSEGLRNVAQSRCGVLRYPDQAPVVDDVAILDPSLFGVDHVLVHEPADDRIEYLGPEIVTVVVTVQRFAVVLSWPPVRFSIVHIVDQQQRELFVERRNRHHIEQCLETGYQARVVDALDSQRVQAALERDDLGPQVIGPQPGLRTPVGVAVVSGIGDIPAVSIRDDFARVTVGRSGPAELQFLTRRYLVTFRGIGEIHNGLAEEGLVYLEARRQILHDLDVHHIDTVRPVDTHRAGGVPGLNGEEPALVHVRRLIGKIHPSVDGVRLVFDPRTP